MSDGKTSSKFNSVFASSVRPLSAAELLTVGGGLKDVAGTDNHSKGDAPPPPPPNPYPNTIGG